MNKLIFFTVAAASVLAAYVLVRNCACSIDNEGQPERPEPKRHLTNAFSNAKQHAVS